MSTQKRSQSFRLSEKAIFCLEMLKRHLGVSKTDVLEIILRESAERYLAKLRKEPK